MFCSELNSTPYPSSPSGGGNGINGFGGGGGGSCYIFSTSEVTGGYGGNGTVIIAWPVTDSPISCDFLTNNNNSTSPTSSPSPYTYSTLYKSIAYSMTYSVQGGILSNDGTYYYITFTSFTNATTSTGSFTIHDGNKYVYYLVVGGGGSGGQAGGGGGGAGGMQFGTLPYSLNTTYSVTAGAGGKPGTGTTTSTGEERLNWPGTDSTITGSGLSSIKVYGGGRGASRDTGTGESYSYETESGFGPPGGYTLAGGCGGGGFLGGKWTRWQ